MKHILLIIIKFYKRFISPILGSNCRFYPTCSSYAQTAIETHGAFSGSWLSLKRIARCQPFSSGGIDPVPDCNHNHS